MDHTFLLRIVTPDRQVVHDDVEEMQLPGKEGYMGILPGHAALLSELGQGKLTLTTAGKHESFNITGGYVEVRDNHVRILADGVE